MTTVGDLLQRRKRVKQKMTKVTSLPCQLRAQGLIQTIPAFVAAQEANCRKLSELAA